MAHTRTSKPRVGFSMIYLVIIMTALMGIATYAVDYGRVQLAKTQMIIAVDAAARAAVVGLATSTTQAIADAKAVAAANPVDYNTGLTLTTSDIVFGKWNATTKVFTANSTPYNAVRINGQRSAARGTAIPLTFGAFVGRSTCNVTSTVTAYRVAPINVTSTIPADSNPWLAGATNGTLANHGSPGSVDDSAPNQSPTQMTGITLTTGQVLTFDGISGTGSNSSSGATTGPDGDSGWIGSNYNGAENGLANLKAPMNSLIGVFLNDTVPNTTSAPSMLDFTSAASRDFTSLSPGLKQPFFIGDGKTSGGSYQQFVVPAGATRLFLCSMDEYEWNNNVGSRTVQINKPQIVSVVE